jgi:DNA polymerase III subunit delta'
MIPLQDIVGQDAAVDRLASLMTSGRLPHAMLFAGPDGVGRETTARALAQVLLCESPQDSDGRPLACGQCSSCMQMQADAHPDFHLIYKELARFHEDAQIRNRVMQNLGIEVIRQFLIAPVGRASTGGRGKVFVVRESELMSNAAQNALLKTLEEPPPGVRLILLTDTPGRLLATTRSRCSLIRFGPLPEEFVVEKLQAELDAETGEPICPDPDRAAFWARFTDGSLGRAIELAGAGWHEIKCELVESLASLGPGGDAALGERLAKLSDERAEQIVKKARADSGMEMSKRLATRQAVATMLQILASTCRDALGLVTEADRPLIHQDQAAAVGQLAERFTAMQLAEIVEQLSLLEGLLWRNVNAKTVWDNVVITCASAAPLRV